MTPQERAVIEAADAWDKRNTTANLAQLHAAVQAWRALPASPAGETVEVRTDNAARDAVVAAAVEHVRRASSETWQKQISAVAAYGWYVQHVAPHLAPATVETEQ